MSRRVEVISQVPVLEAKLFTVNETRVKYTNGIEQTYHDIHRKSAVSVFPITHTYDVYLASQYRYTLQKKTLEAVAGIIEDGEQPLEAAKRELKEELGLTAETWDSLAAVEQSASIIRATQHLFLARDIKRGKAFPEDSEEIAIVKLPLQEAIEKVMSGQINTGMTSIGLFMIDRLRQQKKI